MLDLEFPLLFPLSVDSLDILFGRIAALEQATKDSLLRIILGEFITTEETFLAQRCQ